MPNDKGEAPGARSARIVRTGSASWQSGAKQGEPDYQFIDLSGEHLGARIEALQPGSTSSYHHFHASEEEHVFMLTGQAELFFGDEQLTLAVGDHVWFKAGETIAHHLENRSAGVCSYLVYGERKEDDVVFYPEGQVMLVKGVGPQQFTYRERDV